MTEETFLETLKRALEVATAEVEAMARKKAETKWMPEKLRALAYLLHHGWGTGEGGLGKNVGASVEALACAADEIERLSGELRWAFIRQRMAGGRKGGVTV